MVFTKEEIKQRMQKYGTVYFPEDIVETPDDLIGIEKNKEMLEDFFRSMKKYKIFSDKLKEVRMTPSITVLLYGPPGTGKTSITRALAKQFEIPMCVVEADRLVSPLLGDTLKNMRNVVELASEIAKENKIFLIFFDELDAIASERSNAHEVGEIKRGVISFLQIIDKIDYEGIPLAIFGATNHQSQLDSAVWRRFTYHLYFGFPDFIVRKEIIRQFLKRLEKGGIIVDSGIYSSLDSEEEVLKEKYNEMKANSITPLNIIDFEDNLHNGQGNNQLGLLTLTRGYTGSDIARGIRVSILKAIQKDILEFDDLYSAFMFVGGTKTHVEQQQILSGSVGASNSTLSENTTSKIEPKPKSIPKTGKKSSPKRTGKKTSTRKTTKKKKVAEI